MKKAEKVVRREAGDQVSESYSESESSGGGRGGANFHSDVDEEYAEGKPEQDFVNKDPKVRTAVRNLRQREDVAKYLWNLDPNSARYDAKSRTMRDNPTPHLPEAL